MHLFKKLSFTVAFLTFVHGAAWAANAEDMEAPDAAPSTSTTSSATATNGSDTVNVPRSEWEAMKARQQNLEKELAELKRVLGQGGATPAVPSSSTLPPEEAPIAGEATTPAATSSGAAAGGGKSLLLPDISFIGQAKGFLGNDRRDENRNSLRLTEGELSIQSYVYPGVKADAFITAAPDEDEPFQVEEGYLTFLGWRKGLNVKVGRQHTPFGRAGLQHTHSWLYARQLLPVRNLVSGESLSGDGVNFSYHIPTPGRLFAQADFGFWRGLGSGVISANPFGQDLPVGPGNGYTGNFQTARLWLGHPLGEFNELELGGSYAKGTSTVDNDTGTNIGSGRLALKGVDLSFRHFGQGRKRVLLRSEYFQYAPNASLGTNEASGYYGLANYRYTPFDEIGLLWEHSGFPQAPGQHENALSLIYTKQFTEQFYVRLQGTRGTRPGQGNYNEGILQFTWGVGPHTHNLE